MARFGEVSVKEILTFADELHDREIALRTILCSDYRRHHVSVSDDSHIVHGRGEHIIPAAH